jgi:hypothetical protein
MVEATYVLNAPYLSRLVVHIYLLEYSVNFRRYFWEFWRDQLSLTVTDIQRGLRHNYQSIPINAEHQSGGH